MTLYAQEPTIESTTIADAAGVNIATVSATGALKIDGSAVTQPVSGTVTANAGTNLNTSALALDATLTGGTQKTKLIDTGGTNVLSVSAAGAAKVDGSAVTQPISGTVAATQSGTWTVQPGNTANTTPWLVEMRPTTLATYTASAVGLVSAAAATDIFTLTGSATKTIKVTYITVSGTTTTGSGLGVNVQLIKRSTANSGGTSSALTTVPMDSTNAAGTATALSYTANPTLGTTVGTIRAARYDFVTSGALAGVLMWDFGTRPAQELVLRGTSQVLAINLSATSITGPVIDISIEWTEE